MIHPTYTTIRALIHAFFPVNKKLSIVDYGCGNGYLLEVLPPEWIRSYQGFDINVSSITSAKRTFANRRNVHFTVFDKKHPPHLARNSADCIVCVGVLQYLEDDEVLHVLAQAKRALTKNGILLMSCAVDHAVYRVTNLYQLFLPHQYISRKRLNHQIKKSGLHLRYQQEKGLCLTPLISNIGTLAFDILDKVFLRTKGSLGFFGKTFRSWSNLLCHLDYLIPIDYGYTLFTAAKQHPPHERRS